MKNPRFSKKLVIDSLIEEQDALLLKLNKAYGNQDKETAQALENQIRVIVETLVHLGHYTKESVSKA